MAEHVAHREDEPFRAVAECRKTIESRLYDEKRRKYELGDTITLVNRQTDDRLRVRVIGLLRYKTFKEMFEHNKPTKIGGTSVDWLLSQIREYYTLEDELANGVLGIEFEVLRS